MVITIIMKGEQEMTINRRRGPMQVGEIENGKEDRLSVIEVEIRITTVGEDDRRRNIDRIMSGRGCDK